MERKFVLAVVAFLNRQCTVVGHRRLRNEILIGREIGIDIVELRSGCEKCLKITHGACHGTGIQKNIPNGENAVQSPGADHKVRSEIGKERKQRVFSVCDGGEAGEVEVHRQEMFHGLSKLCVEKVIKMTDADIVRAPFFQRRIGEIIGNRVGMVVALVQLYLFLRTPAVDAGGKCKLHTTEQEQCKHRKRRGEKVIPAAVGQKKQTEQEKQGIENREQGSDQRMNDNELVTHISRSHGGDVGAPDGIHRLCFFEFLKLQLQRLCGDFLFRACKTEFFLAVEILTADFFKQSQPILRKQKDDNSIQTGAVRLCKQ